VARSTLVVTARVAADEAAEAGAAGAETDGAGEPLGGRVAEADGPAPEAQPCNSQAQATAPRAAPARHSIDVFMVIGASLLDETC
jgi:hypothetical protein